jgi:hypothetical protein
LVGIIEGSRYWHLLIHVQLKTCHVVPVCVSKRIQLPKYNHVTPDFR